MIKQMRPHDLSKRLLEFSANVIKQCKKMYKNPIEKHIGLQLVRSATSSGANYEEACGAQSRSNFIHKMQIVLKELRETSYWLKLIVCADIGIVSNLENIINECEALKKIIGKSVKTAKQSK